MVVVISALGGFIQTSPSYVCSFDTSFMLFLLCFQVSLLALVKYVWCKAGPFGPHLKVMFPGLGINMTKIGSRHVASWTRRLPLILRQTQKLESLLSILGVAV